MPDPPSDRLPEQAARAAAQVPLIRCVFRLAAELGVPIWLVGGSVRDLLRGAPVHDLDFAVDGDGLALARAVANRLGGAYVPLDRERRTGRVVLAAPGAPATYLDIAALRGPDLEADLRDRDFTLNAMALEPGKGETLRIVDPLGGAADLAQGVLRAPAAHSFAGDPVRTLRAVRLQAQFGFDIEPQTWDWLQAAVPLLPTVSAERVRDEWFKILEQPRAGIALRTLDALGLLQIVARPLDALSEWEVYARGGDALEAAFRAVEAMEGLWVSLPYPLRAFGPPIHRRYATPICDERSRLAVLKCAALLHNVGLTDAQAGTSAAQAAAGGEIAQRLARAWRCSNAEAQLLRVAVEEHVPVLALAAGPALDRRAIYRFFRRSGEHGVDAAFLALAVHLARHPAPDAGTERLLETVRRLWEAYFERYEQVVEPPLLLGGADLIRLGIAPGPRLGALLARLQEAQAAGEIETRAQALAQVAAWASEEGSDADL